jgi:hypothetical protein
MFLAREPGMYPFLRAPRPGLETVRIETNSVDEVTARLAGLEGLTGLLTFSELYVAIVAEAARRLGRRYLSPEAARRCRNKHETRPRAMMTSLHRLAELVAPVLEISNLWSPNHDS